MWICEYFHILMDVIHERDMLMNQKSWFSDLL